VGLVLGKMKRGKSTFIDAVQGANALARRAVAGRGRSVAGREGEGRVTKEILGGFSDRRERLAGLIAQLRTVADALEWTALATPLATLDAHVTSARFVGLVLGELKRGKSTFINAMLGAKVLPAFPWETTAITCNVQFGETPQALLYPMPANGSARAPVA